MNYYHIITCFLLLLTLSSCTDYQEHPHDGVDLTGAWVLQHVKFPSGTEQKYAMDNDGTSCLIYDHNNMLYECNISTTPTGLIIQPTAKSTVTLIDKGRPALKDAVILTDRTHYRGRWKNRTDSWVKHPSMSDKVVRYIVERCKTKDTPTEVQRLIKQDLFK